MYRIIYWKHGTVLQSFADSSDLLVPLIAKSENAYACRDVPIEDVGVQIPMYWCRPRRYNDRWLRSDLGPNSQSNSNSDSSPVQNVVREFLLAGSLLRNHRVYVFSPNVSNVRMMLQLDHLRPWRRIDSILFIFQSFIFKFRSPNFQILFFLRLFTEPIFVRVFPSKESIILRHHCFDSGFPWLILQPQA